MKSVAAGKCDTRTLVGWMRESATTTRGTAAATIESCIR